MHHRKHVIPIFCVGGHFRKILHSRLPRSEEDLEKVTVRSEISTWRVVLAVTFGILLRRKNFLDCEPYLSIAPMGVTTPCLALSFLLAQEYYAL